MYIVVFTLANSGSIVNCHKKKTIYIIVVDDKNINVSKFIVNFLTRKLILKNQ